MMSMYGLSGRYEFIDEKKKQSWCLVSAGSLIIDSDILNFLKNLSFSLVYVFLLFCCLFMREHAGKTSSEKSETT